MKRYLKLIPHVILLLILATAEGFRLTEFFRMLTGSLGAGIASAIVTVIVVTYLAIYRMNWTSFFAMLICILLSFGSFLEPFQELRKERMDNAIETAEAKRLPLPQWDAARFWYGGGETYRKAFEAEVKHVEEHNRRVDAATFSDEQKEFSLSRYVIFALGVIVMAICVPLLAFVISHKLSLELNELTKIKPAPALPPRTAGNAGQWANPPAQPKKPDIWAKRAELKAQGRGRK